MALCSPSSLGAVRSPRRASNGGRDRGSRPNMKRDIFCEISFTCGVILPPFDLLGHLTHYLSKCRACRAAKSKWPLTAERCSRSGGTVCWGGASPAAFPRAPFTLAALFLRYAPDGFPLDQAEHFLHNRGASVATLRWCSGSSRNAVRLPFGNSVRLRRNPHTAAGRERFAPAIPVSWLRSQVASEFAARS